MITKKSNLFIFALNILLMTNFFLPVKAHVCSITSENNPKSNKIKIEGNLSPRSQLRSSSEVVEAIIMNQDIHLTFYENIGSITISITHKLGNIVYCTTINAEELKTFSISLFGLEKGSYTLKLKNDIGEMWGDFEMQ